MNNNTPVLIDKLKQLANRVEQYAESGCIEGYWYNREEENYKHRDKSLCELVEEVRELLEEIE